MGVIINGGLNVSTDTGVIVNTSSYSTVSVNGAFTVNKNGNVSVKARPYSTNLTVQCGGNPLANAQIVSVSIGGGPAYIIQQGSFPVYAALPSTFISAHHFGGTSITVTEANNATMELSINGVPKEGDCLNPITGTYTYNYTFTANDIIVVSSSECGG
jgi:hypothetical protein